MKVKVVTCDIYSRIVGYYTPTRLWNKGKSEEWKLRHVISNMDIERAVNNDERSE